MYKKIIVTRTFSFFATKMESSSSQKEATEATATSVAPQKATEKEASVTMLTTGLIKIVADKLPEHHQASGKPFDKYQFHLRTHEVLIDPDTVAVLNLVPAKEVDQGKHMHPDFIEIITTPNGDQYSLPFSSAENAAEAWDKLTLYLTRNHKALAPLNTETPVLEIATNLIRVTSDLPPGREFKWFTAGLVFDWRLIDTVELTVCNTLLHDTAPFNATVHLGLKSKEKSRYGKFENYGPTFPFVSEKKAMAAYEALEKYVEAAAEHLRSVIAAAATTKPDDDEGKEQ